MSASNLLLFIGGPIHGQVRHVTPDMNVVRIPIDPAQTGNLLGQTATYVRRAIAAGDAKHKRERSLMVDDTVPPEVAMQGLAQVLVFAWVTAPDLPGGGLGWPPAEIPEVQTFEQQLSPLTASPETHAQRRVAALERASLRAAKRREVQDATGGVYEPRP